MPTRSPAALALGAYVGLIRAVDPRSPDLAARLALPLFRRTGPRLPVRASERAVHESARRRPLLVRGRELVSYEWGWGADTVLLAHGWRGRAAQFAPLIRELRAEGVRVVAFDAPANGDSAGRRADIRDWIGAIEALHAREGRFRAIVGHSFGALAARTAVVDGVATDALVAIAGMADARVLVDQFALKVGLGAASADALAGHFARIVFDDPRAWDRFDGIARPLPESVPLLVVHDRGDREVPFGEALRLHAAHGDRSRLVLTTGAGHTRVLGVDPTLDAVVAFVTGGTAAVDRLALAATPLDAADPIR